MNQLEDKIARLRSIYVTAPDQRILDDTENTLRRALADQKIAEIPSIEELVTAAYAEIQNVNFLLAFDEALTIEDRKALFRERRVHQFYLERLGGWRAERMLDNLDALLTKKLQSTG